MEQLILDISTKKDVALIKELLTHFKGVKVNGFSSLLGVTQTAKRIEEGLRDAEEGDVKPWNEIKPTILKRIANV